MTGVGDVLVDAFAVVRGVTREKWLKLFAMLVALADVICALVLPTGAANAVSRALAPDARRTELRRAVTRVGARVPQPRVPDALKSLRAMEGGMEAGTRGGRVAGRTKKDRKWRILLPQTSRTTKKDRKWGILLPLTSRTTKNETELGNIEELVWRRLETNLDALVKKSTRLQVTNVYVAIDLKDPVFDRSEARERLRFLLRKFKHVIFMDPLVPAYEGALCRIWALMAKRAVADGAEFVILLGDDVEMKTDGWQDDVEECFQLVARERNLPYGCACIAVRDKNFEGFPTFPVIHRFHFDAFDGELFPDEFLNQHGDPFLFEIYRRWGASRFTNRSYLVNTIGGAGEARYVKSKRLIWRADVLTRAIDRMAYYLHSILGQEAASSAMVPCINVVIPTYRCDVDRLRALTNLECRRDVSLTTIVVVDRPDAEALSDIRALASYASNRIVRVLVKPKNEGASAARNDGLAQSFGDYCVLLDDDVIPESGLLDAYLGAIDRTPGAAAYVGLTTLPSPSTAFELALVASRICTFYGIAGVVEQPPWGVTANICVKCRTNNSVIFSNVYPRTGGGEDVDYCFRIQLQGYGSLVAVPGARVLHPFWKSPLRQVQGWAAGDVLCLDALPHRGFRALPNWAEYSVYFLLVALACATFGNLTLAQKFVKFALYAIVIEIAMLYPRFYANCRDVHRNVRVCCIAALLGTVPIMLQDGTRLASKIIRLRLHKICKHFDFMNGRGNNVREMRFALAVKNVLLLIACVTQAPLSGAAKVTVRNVWLVIYALWYARQTGYFTAFKQKMLRGPELPFRIEPGVTPFVVLSHMRTGSNLLCGYLSAIQGINMNSELFNAKAIYGTNGEIVNDPTLLRRRDEDPCQFLKDILDKRSVHCTSVGFKLFPEHISRDGGQVLHEFFERLLADPRIKKIVLRRRNRVATCASLLRSFITGSFISKNLDHVPVHIKPSDLRNFITGYDKYYEFIEERLAGQQWIDMTYETLVNKSMIDGELHRVCEFLGVSVSAQARDESVEKSVPRQTYRPLNELITNFAELHSAFAGTEREIDFTE